MPRRILLSATGLSPQVVTETLYCLATAEGTGRFLPDEVHIVSTKRGADLARSLFLDDRLNPLDRLCRQYDIPLPQVRVHEMRGPGGPLDDLRTAEDNGAAANSILKVVRGLTSRDDTAIHFSIAGGRKTMGYYLGTCASMLARSQDSMSHVLVADPFESAADFFFPPRPSEYMLVRGQPVSTAQARVDLAPVGFIRLRSMLPSQLIDRGDFTQIVSVVDAMLVKPQVVVRLAPPVEGHLVRHGELEVGGGLVVPLQAKSFAMYWLLAKAATHDDPWIQAAMDPAILRRHYLPVYRQLVGLGAKFDDEEHMLATYDGHFMPKDYLNAIGRLASNLKKRLGGPAAAIYGPRGEGRGSALRHRLDLPADAIRFEGE